MGLKNKKTLVLIFLAVFMMIFSASASAQYTYTPLEDIPGFNYPANGTGAVLFEHLLESLYKFGIWTVGIAALLMITIGGFMYMTSAGNTAKAGTAKGIIWDAIYGLIVALFAWLILFIINPDFTSISLTVPEHSLNTNPDGSSRNTSPSNPQNTPPAPTRPTQPPPSQGSCQGLGTQQGIASQCGDASPELSSLLSCIRGQQPNAVISSISDSQGLSRCQTNYNRPPCAHAQNSCHYGGRSCRSAQRSYGVDFTTRNVSASDLIAAGRACGAAFSLNEGNHVHMSVGNCGCN